MLRSWLATGRHRALRVVAVAATAAASAQASHLASYALPADGTDSRHATRQKLLHALLDAGSSTDDADSQASSVKLAVKGERMCARILLPVDALVPALMPILRAFPQVTWSADASSGAGSESILLRPVDGSPNGVATPLLSLFVPKHDALAELEILGARSDSTIGGSHLAPTLGDREVRALAEALVAAHHYTGAARANKSRLAPTGPELSRHGGILGDFFGLQQPSSGSANRSGSPTGGGGGSPVERLEAMGIRVILPRGDKGTKDGADNAEKGTAPATNGDAWDTLAGSDDVRRALEENLLLPLLHPDVYEEVMKGTRQAEVAPHAKAILFTGPPGCGKTSTARILANKLQLPFVALCALATGSARTLNIGVPASMPYACLLAFSACFVAAYDDT